MTNSIFEILKREQLTRLNISYDWKTGTHQLSAARLWDHQTNFAHYNKSFTTHTPLLAKTTTLDTQATTSLFAQHHALDHLQNILSLLQKGKHLGIECFYHEPQNIRFINNIHSDTLGINNRSHALRAGGIRRHDLNEDELDVIIDGLNLSRGMSFKNFAARIPHGGNKMTVIMEPLDLEDHAALGFLAYALDHSRTFTGPDMGFPPELADTLKENFTLNITGGPKGPLGPTGTPTAFGTYLAAKEAVQFRANSPSLQGMKIAVQGLGAVGFPLCEHYLKDGAALIVADTNHDQVKKLKAQHPNATIEVTDHDKIMFAEADLFSPCALGGIITKKNIPQLRFKTIIGAANNQLQASSQEEECALATDLQRHNILFQIAWWHNLGGVLCGHEEYTHQKNASMQNVLDTTQAIVTKHTRKNLTESNQLGITPTERAYRTAENAIYPA